VKRLKAQSFLKGGSPDRSLVIGAPTEFDFLASLRDAISIKAAIAFGHMSGWNQVSKALANSHALCIQILLGQSFLQTEPDVLEALCKLESPCFHGSSTNISSQGLDRGVAQYLVCHRWISKFILRRLR
jgi:hypothetical protein